MEAARPLAIHKPSAGSSKPIAIRVKNIEPKKIHTQLAKVKLLLELPVGSLQLMLIARWALSSIKP